MPKRFAHPKLQGEWAECAFLHAALDRGFIVSKPWGDSSTYDFIVDNAKTKKARRRRRLWLVQVRSVSVKGGWTYRVRNCHHQNHSPFTAHDADFIVVLVIPCAAWYIIPIAEVPPTRQMLTFFPQTKNSRGRYERFREAWHLLGGTFPSGLKS